MRRSAELKERLLLALCLVGLGCYIGWTLEAGHRRIEAIERERLATQATVIDENLGRQLTGVDNALKSIRDDLPFLGAQSDAAALIKHRLQSLSNSMPGVRTINVLDKDGVAVSSNRDNVIGISFAWREYFKLARQNDNADTLYVSAPFETVPVGAFAMNLVRVVSDAHGGFAGIVSATLDPTYFSTLLSSVTDAPDMWASLVHADGKLFLIAPAHDIPVGSDLAQPGSLFTRHMESGQVATLMTGAILANGEKRMVARRTVRPALVPMDKPLVVAVTRDLAVVFAPWRRNVILQSMGFGLLVMVSCVGLYGFQRRQRAYALLVATRDQDRIRVETILRTASDGIHIVDRDGLLLEANEAFLRMLGYDQGAVGRLRIPDWDAGDPWEVVKARNGDLITHRDRMVFETRHRRQDGSIVDVEINAVGIDIGGKGYLCAASRDITQRKLADQLMRDKDYLLSESQRIAHVGSWHYNLTGDLTWSDETYRIYRLSPDSFVPTVEALMALIHPNDKASMQAWIAACAAGEKPGSLDFRIVTADGAVRVLSGRGELVCDGGNKPSHLLGTVHDITERHQAETRLRESEERFRSLVEGTTDWVWETDSNHCFSWFSSSFDTVIGTLSDPILGKRRWDVASPEREIDPAVWQAHMEDLGEHRKFRDFRYWIPTANGRARWISISGSPRCDDDGHFLGYRGSGSDITAEAATTLRMKMLSTVFEQSPMTVVITDPTGVIEYVNSHFTIASGYEAGEALGMNSRIFASGEMPADAYRDMWATITAGRRWAGEMLNRRKDGTLYWEMVVIAPVMNDEGQVAHYVAIKEDVTERRGLVDKLTRTNAELEQFAYVASHDLRQPLRMVTSYLTLIEKRLGADLGDDLKQFFGYAIGGARRMDRLIIDLLEYSRTGKTKEFVAVPLAKAVDRAVLNLTVAIGEANGEIVVAKDLPVVAGDPTELIRLFQNLIGNAVKYRAPERSPLVEIGCRRQGREWLVSIQDNGIGIAPEDRDRAFAIFQRLVTQDAYEGTGIGLAVCKKIVEHHGGRIWIESEVGRGSTFFLTLPA